MEKTSVDIISTNKEVDPPTKAMLSYPVKFTFYITYVLLLTTATITFIEALRTTDPAVRHIMNLETCISVVAAYFYSNFVAIVNEANTVPIEWTSINRTRYIDWSITTPFMLLSLMLSLGRILKEAVHLKLFLSVIALNYAMLYMGYLGETEVLSRTTASAAGFVPFVGMFSLIYVNYVKPKAIWANRALFFAFVAVWAMYGIVYSFDDENKNIAFNILDAVAKCFIGICLWIYFTKIIVL
jgi:hypothetical protein